MSEDNPLLKALPPVTDYITYLTLLEYNLTKEQLPTLHGILQDTTLTVNIGWDLVHLLLPLLPESEQCLRDLATLGNPREVILKTTELLEEIAREEEGEEEADEKEGEAEPVKAATDQPEDGDAPISVSPELPVPGRPSRETRFDALVSMLTILHPRIKTKYPSRFLSTSLQSVLSAYSALDGSTIATESILSFAKRLSGAKRPEVPPRKSSSSITTLKAAQAQATAPDPEANTDGVASGEAELQRKLMQSFLTYVTEVYLTSLRHDNDAPGLSYAARYQEHIQPEKNIPGRGTLRELFQEDNYHVRDSTIGQILALQRDIKLNPSDLVATLSKQTDQSTEESETDLPSNPSDVPLSLVGCLHILCAWLASPVLFDTPPPFDIGTPEYTTLVNALLHPPSSPEFGLEDPTFLDAIFFLGIYKLHNEPSISPTSNQELNDAVQRLSLLSAQLPNPTQRYQAHQLASNLLHLHPSSEAKLAYIKDTLEFCPYDSLKASAVGWIKDEILAANESQQRDENESGAGIFTHEDVLDDLGEWLWGDRVGVPLMSSTASNEEKVKEFTALQNLLPFYLSVLNLLFLLLRNDTLYKNLHVSEIVDGVKDDFVNQLTEAAKQYEKALEAGELDDADDKEIRNARAMQLGLLTMNCQQVLEKMYQRQATSGEA